MSFPIVHLRAADIVACELNLSDKDAASFLLGNLAPDGIHYRTGLAGASHRDIGEEKKITHLCPPTGELWGRITDNDRWLAEIKKVSLDCPNDYFALGYIMHVLTDVYNNLTLWKDFRENHPKEAANVYGSNYYREMGALDLQLYQETESERILRLLPLAEARAFPERVTAEEVNAIRDSILFKNDTAYTQYEGQPPADTSRNRYVTAARIREFIDKASGFALLYLPML
ncbi:MAG: hypothetical protein FWE90_05485 [Defluviitaleaceae bacterium]|nr:hypothetical protein [Defluviitaleaceae bacterium]